jgi:hypothetical protein
VREATLCPPRTDPTTPPSGPRDRLKYVYCTHT